MTRVVILQEYVPTYRVPFFDRLVELAAGEGIEVVVAAGRPNDIQAQRGDNANPAYLVPISQREIRLGPRRLVLRNAFGVAVTADLLILEQARRNLDAYLLFLPRFLRRSSWALWGHGRDYVESRSRFSRWLQAALTNRSDWFFAYTPGGARHLETLSYPRGRITTVMNAIDTDDIKSGIKSVTTAQASGFHGAFGLKGKVVTFIGALDESKRIHFLINSIRMMNADINEVSFVIAGDGPLRSDLIEYASDLPNVHFIGRVDAKLKFTLLSISYLLAVPGRVGLIAVDSLAAGIPIVTTNWEFHAPEFEYLTTGVNSVVTANTERDYAKAIDELISNDETRAELARNALSTGDGIGIEQMSRNFLDGIVAAVKTAREK